MKNKILCITVILAVLLSLASVSVLAADGDVYDKVYAIENYVNVVIDGEVVNTPDIVIDGTTYLGLRAISEALGYTVEWDDESKIAILGSGGAVNLGTEVIEKGTSEELKDIYVLTDYVNAIFIDGEPVRVKNLVREGRTYLGLRDMGEILGYEVNWDDKTNTASLTKIIPVTTKVKLQGDVTSDYDALATVYYKFYAVNYPNEKSEAINNQVANEVALYRYFKYIAENNSLKYDLGDLNATYKEYQASYGSEEEYKTVLELFNLSEEEDYLFFRASTELNTIQPAVVDYLYDNLESIKALKEQARVKYNTEKEGLTQDITRVKHILIPTVDLATGEALSAEGKAEAKTLANSVQNQAKKSRNFDELVKKYNKDEGQPEDGYEVVYDSQFVPEFEEAALKLNKGDVSGVVETTYGYHILKCTDKYSKTPTFDEYFEAYYANDYTTMMQDAFADWAEENPIKFTVIPE